ncbi:entericidin A/B family lipoprotein [Novosphingobium sp.]|nr:entericidin A/B family lipoprotein [Novosphingobium sp.]MCC6924803.1 entericidin A/B family lipoprotein [Novosphingobium sp.]
MIRKFAIVLAAGALAMGASACNTVKGLGKDIQSVGEAGDRATR